MQLTNWLLEHASALSLRADKYTWVNEWLPGFFDYGVIIKLNDKEYVGRGIDTNERLSFEKASAEALERAAVSIAGLKNPWSTAAYPTFDGACERAYWELLGIDRVFCHHFTRRKMSPVSLSVLSSLFSVEKFKKILTKNAIVLNLYELTPALDAKIYCAIAFSNQKKKFEGFIAGFGASKSADEARLHAFIECVRTAVVCLFTDYKPDKPIDELKRQGAPRWHFWKAQTKEALQYLQENLLPDNGQEVQLEPEDISIADIRFTKIDALDKIFPDIPLVFVQASSDKLITPQFGEFVGDDKTMKRLESFNGGPVIINTSVPHFYG